MISFFKMTPVLLLLIAVACASGNPATPRTSPQAPSTTASARDTTEKPQSGVNAADVSFISGMIGHHAQAIVMSKWAPTHGASPAVVTLAERIINAQQDEITAMRKWLGDHHQPVPEVSAHGIMMDMNGMHHEMVMPGMLTDAQLKQLDEARGKEFDRLFLTFMIQHHEGALRMVKDLFDTPLAGQDVDVSVFANDVQTVQTAEIGVMRQMLNVL